MKVDEPVSEFNRIYFVYQFKLLSNDFTERRD